jgi:hypothetical protein
MNNTQCLEQENHIIETLITVRRDRPHDFNRTILALAQNAGCTMADIMMIYTAHLDKEGPDDQDARDAENERLERKIRNLSLIGRLRRVM